MSDGIVPTLADLAATGDLQRDLHARAAAARDHVFGRKAFVRGVVEVSNFCRENCGYCGMRRDNRALERYRAEADPIAELILNHRPASITDLNIQTGEDPRAVEEVILPLLKTLRRETSLGLSVCLGTLNADLYRALADAGASIYIIKFEIASPEAYRLHSAPGTQQERLEHIRLLAGIGWNVSSGFIAGLPGQGPEDMLENLRMSQSLPLSGCSVSPFVPGEATPLSTAPASGIDLALNSMAAMRLMRPDWVIPAVSALNIAEPGAGYRRGLATGANLCTINLTPDGERENYLLYKRDRVIMNEERILSAIAAEGLSVSTTSLAAHFAGKRAELAGV
jgi:biotin synthase